MDLCAFPLWEHFIGALVASTASDAAPLPCQPLPSIEKSAIVRAMDRRRRQALISLATHNR
jgi:hypothetical protein